MTRRGCETATILWACVALFAARVIGQFEALLLSPAWLPPMDAWYSGLLPYYLLLPLQVALLTVMTTVAWNRRVRTGRFALANPRLVATLRGLAVFYFLAMAARLGLNVAENGADFWRAGAIPVAFHWVLALFLLVSSRAAHAAFVEDFDEIPIGDVPAFAQPLILKSRHTGEM